MVEAGDDRVRKGRGRGDGDAGERKRDKWGVVEVAAATPHPVKEPAGLGLARELLRQIWFLILQWWLVKPSCFTSTLA